MRVDPLTEAITSVFEAIAFPSLLLLAVLLLAVGALELRSRIRRPERKSNAGERRGRSDRLAPAAR